LGVSKIIGLCFILCWSVQTQTTNHATEIKATHAAEVALRGKWQTEETDARDIIAGTSIPARSTSPRANGDGK
jgi:hypothetical protein